MIYDLNTKNKSFLRMAKELKENGVKNYANHLILYDESLVGVDVYSKNLTPEQKARIYAELTINPWYYFREVSRFEAGNEEGALFDCRIGSYMIIWSHIKNINTFTVLSRQLGKTTTHLAWYAWLMLFSVRNRFVVFSLQEHTAKKTVLAKWRWFVDILPAWLKELVTDYADQNSTEEKSLAKQKNKILCFGGAVNDDGADRSARSFTSADLLMDEVAFFKSNQAFYEAASQATNTAMYNAKKNGMHYGIHMTTTPNRRDEGAPHGMWAYNFFNTGAPFRYEILDYNDEQLDYYLKNNSYNGMKPNGFLRLEFDWKVSGMPQSWYDNALTNIGNNLQKIKQELELEWPLTDDGSVFEEEELSILEKYSKKEVKSVLKLLKDKYYLDFYEEMYPFATYIISVDTASGYGLDGTSINLIDPIDYHIVATLNSNRIDSDDLHELIVELMQTWFREAFLVIEAAPIAIPVLTRLVKIGDIERRTFKRLTEKPVEKRLKDGTIEVRKAKVWRYGVNTTIQSRPQMMDLLRTIVIETPQVITSPLVFNDIRNLRYHNGKIQASPGTHDDNVMSYLITRWAIAYTPYFRGKRFIGGSLTKDLLVEGSKIYSSMDEQTGEFNKILGISEDGTTTSSKDISSSRYADRAEKNQEDNANKNRERFRQLMF